MGAHPRKAGMATCSNHTKRLLCQKMNGSVGGGGGSHLLDVLQRLVRHPPTGYKAVKRQSEPNPGLYMPIRDIAPCAMPCCACLPPSQSGPRRAKRCTKAVITRLANDLHMYRSCPCNDQSNANAQPTLTASELSRQMRASSHPHCTTCKKWRSAKLLDLLLAGEGLVGHGGRHMILRGGSPGRPPPVRCADPVEL